MDELTPKEAQFLHNLEVLQLPVGRAAAIAGISNQSETLRKPAVMAARDEIRAAVARRVNITKEDVINGIKDAIEQAKLIDEPMTQIAGWREIAKMLGYDAPKQVNVTISGTVKEVRRQISALTDSELVESLGAGDVIDGDFYEPRQLGHG